MPPRRTNRSSPGLSLVPTQSEVNDPSDESPTGAENGEDGDPEGNYSEDEHNTSSTVTNYTGRRVFKPIGTLPNPPILSHTDNENFTKWKNLFLSYCRQHDIKYLVSLTHEESLVRLQETLNSGINGSFCCAAAIDNHSGNVDARKIA